MEGEGSSQGEGPRRKWTSDVRTSDVEVGPSQVPTQGQGGRKWARPVPILTLSHSLKIIIITLLSTGQLQPLGSACCTHRMINPHNHYYYSLTQMRKLRSREVNWLAQGHPATKWLSGICAQVCLSPQCGPWASGTPDAPGQFR